MVELDNDSQSLLDRELRSYPRRFRDKIRGLGAYLYEKGYEKAKDETTANFARIISTHVASMKKIQT